MTGPWCGSLNSKMITNFNCRFYFKLDIGLSNNALHFHAGLLKNPQPMKEIIYVIYKNRYVLLAAALWFALIVVLSKLLT